MFKEEGQQNLRRSFAIFFNKMSLHEQEIVPSHFSDEYCRQRAPSKIKLLFCFGHFLTLF